jgi:6-phosphogluconolactonase/glucosamine-6-phosphate isomerase/deaminase
MSRAAADLIVAFLKAKPMSMICLASGHSPRGIFECLIEDVREKRISLHQCTFVSLDEWIGIGPSDDGSCRAMMDQDLFVPLGIEKSQIVFFDGLSKDSESDVARINKLIDRNGGLDIMLVGVGTNGHIAMNEPGTPFQIRAHLSTLAEETISVGQKYFKKATALSRGITLGLGHFQESRLPILIANGEKKKPIVNRILASLPDEALPASIVHQINGAYVMLTEDTIGKPDLYDA